ncbi:hypothetical protein L6452_40625 [Arctium lappa]|uniref:Uncharacterized protein n=1 Tax=Arctium lappa TaxID=4217 RepID=A0ACB8XMP0_ARCLA|nr:hypothetical protein L6452_40625 [Arctium lappa]
MFGNILVQENFIKFCFVIDFWKKSEFLIVLRQIHVLREFIRDFARVHQFALASSKAKVKFTLHLSSAKISLRHSQFAQFSIFASHCSRKTSVCAKFSASRLGLFLNFLMDSAKCAFQAQFYKNDLMMQLGKDTSPPVLINENEFTQWQDRFINFIERQANGENMMKSFTEGPFIRPKNDTPLTAEEVKREKAN